MRERADRRTAARARVVELRVTMNRSTGEADLVSLNAAAKPVLDELEALGDDEGLAAVLLHLGRVNQDSFEQSSGFWSARWWPQSAPATVDVPRGRPGSWGPS